MSNLFVLKCQDETTGEQILAKLRELQARYLIMIEDAALVTLNANGKPKVRQANDLAGKCAGRSRMVLSDGREERSYV